MKRRGAAIVLILLLCAAALCSGALLILHADHHCRSETCSVCAMLAQDAETFLCLPLAAAGLFLCGGADRARPWTLSENRFVPEWTLVRRKVKLQD